jgi:uncharacterized protein YjbI with pentapeptide repeats
MELKKVEDLLKLYSEGVRDFSGLELEEDSEGFVGVDLSNSNFENSFLVGNFTGANLNNVSFVGANLKTSRFNNSNLENANFSNAALCATEFKGAILSGAIFTGAYFHSSVLKAGEIPSW